MSSLHSKVQPGSAKTPGPDINDTLHLLVKEGLLTLAEWDHYHKMLKVTAMAKLCKNLIQIGPSGVRALPLAAGINVGGHYKWHFFLFFLSSLILGRMKIRSL